MRASLEGKTAIVTGAARGVGGAIAQRLLDAGARVMLSDSDETRLRAAPALDDKQSAAQFCCNLSQKFGVNNLIAATLDAFGRIDILITTATDSELGDPLALSLKQLDRVFATNVKAAFLISQAVAQRMIQAPPAPGAMESGAIVHVSGPSGGRSSPHQCAQAMSAAALDQLTRTQAVTLAPRHVRVNAVAPAGVMTQALRAELQEHPHRRAEIVSRSPLGRIGEVDEVADVALFLASEGARFITGQVLVVDGGRAAQEWPMLNVQE